MSVEIRFISENEDSLLRISATQSNFLRIHINHFDDDDSQCRYVILDKLTAIKFAKEIRRQISFLED
jgi:hypothetical protein